MPEATQKEDDKSVPNDINFAHTATAHGDIDIIAKPSCQGDVPSTPKLSDVAAEIRYIEVAHQLYSKEFGGAYGDVGIAREVAIDLESEENGSKEQGATALVCVILEHFIHIHGAIIGHHYLLEQAPQDLPHPISSGVEMELAFFQKLRQKVSRTLDGACHQLREKRDESKKGNNIFRRLNLATIDIDGITQRLESVERYAYGKYNLQQQTIRGNVEQLRKLGDEKVVILENGQNQEVQDDVGRGYQFLSPL